MQLTVTIKLNIFKFKRINWVHFVTNKKRFLQKAPISKLSKDTNWYCRLFTYRMSKIGDAYMSQMGKVLETFLTMFSFFKNKKIIKEFCNLNKVFSSNFIHIIL